MKLFPKKSYLLYASPLIAVFIYFIIQAFHAPYSDYAGYYFGSKEILKGNYLQVYDPGTFNSLIEREGYKNIFVAYTPFPPFTSLVVSPFLVFDLAISKLIFNILSCAVFVFSLIRLAKILKATPWIIAILPIIFFIPIKNNILFGQAYFLLFSLLTEGYIAFLKKRIIGASVFWSIAILFKLFPAFIIFYLLIRKQYKYAIYLTAFSILLFFASMLACGFDSWKFYLTEIIPRMGKGELNNAFTATFQSMFMLLKNLFIHDPLFNPNSFLNSPYIFTISLSVFQGIILTTIISVSLITKKGFSDIGVWLLASVLLSPNGSTYSLIILALPLLLFAPQVTHKRVSVLLFVILLISNLPLEIFTALPQTLFKFPRLVLLLILFYCLYATYKATFSFRIFFVTLILFTFSNRRFLRTDTDKSAYLLSKIPNIITDFSITNNLLRYQQLTVDGRKEVFTSLSFNNPTQEGIYVSNNQIFLGQRQVTNSSDWKKNPILADSAIIYLSDKNRGPGFYTLRILSLKEHPIPEK